MLTSKNSRAPTAKHITHEETCVKDRENNYIIKSKIKLSSVAAKDTGLYICNAVNQIGEVACSVRLEVRDLKAIQERINSRPEISLGGVSDKNLLRLVKLTAGKTARITMAIKANPLPAVTWHKNGAKLFQGGRLSMFSEQNKTDQTGFVLKIQHVSKIDEGLYTILAKNEYGISKNLIDIVVKDPSWRDIFERVPENTLAFEGSDITLFCKTKKKTTVVWKRHTRVIDSSWMSVNRFKIKSDGYDHSLTLSGIEQADAAKYWAFVGDVGVCAQVDIAESIVSQQSSSLPEPLQIISRPGVKDVEIPNKGTLVLQYKLNYPEVECEWRLNGNLLIDGVRSRIRHNDELHTLVLGNVTHKDNGIVNFRVKNPPVDILAGDLEGNVSFKCILAPSPPINVAAALVEDGEAIIKWDFDENTVSKIDQVIIETRISDRSDWERFMVLPPVKKECKIPIAQQSQEFRVGFSNAAGNSEWTEVKVPKCPEIAVLRGLKNITVERFQPIHLAVEISKEIDDNDIEWRINGAKIREVNENVVLDKLGNVYTITIPEFDQVGDIDVEFRTKPLHGGNMIKTECTVTVQEKPINIMAQLENLECHVKDQKPIKFMCSLVEPLEENEKISWKFNGETLLEGDHGFKFSKEHDKIFILTVEDFTRIENELNTVEFEAIGKYQFFIITLKIFLIIDHHSEFSDHR